jgi:hypothetical protein
MQKRETKIPLRSWEKPEVRRIATGSAEFGADIVSDGSGTFS